MADLDEIPAAKGQQYNLKWTNYSNNILQVFSDHLVQECLVDVTLFCEGRLVKAHKIMLSACSLYFREIFEVYTDRQPLVILNGARFDVLKQLIEFMYRGEVKVQDADVADLLQLAETLQVKGLCNVREKSGGLLPTEAGGDEDGGSGSSKETSPQSQVSTGDSAKHKKTTAEVRKAKSATTYSNTKSYKSGRRRSLIDVGTTATSSRSHKQKDSSTSLPKENSTSLDLHIKAEPGTSADENSGDESALVIDESPYPQNSQLSDSDTVEPQAKKSKTSKDSEEFNNSSSTTALGPPNAFMLFINEFREQLRQQFPDDSNKEISVRLGKLWKNLAPVAKERFYEAASRAASEYKAKNLADKKMRKTPTPTPNISSGNFYEPMQLVKLVMDDENSESTNTNDVIDVESNKTTPIPNGNSTSTKSSKTEL